MIELFMILASALIIIRVWELFKHIVESVVG